MITVANRLDQIADLDFIEAAETVVHVNLGVLGNDAGHVAVEAPGMRGPFGADEQLAGLYVQGLDRPAENLVRTGWILTRAPY